ncbi:MAG TPA: ATP-binding cassette domain-containing protein, partial [Agriterribacter sp.]|nr:ATP-binding cassette domain-containing protein [Agriterribacter sp.]
MAFPFLKVEQLTVQLRCSKILDHIDLVIQMNEQWAITGPSGSGKTMLAYALSGRQHYAGQLIFNGQTANRPRIVMVEQQHRFKDLSNTANFYYQQRYNASDADNTLTVAEALNPDNRQHTPPLSSGIHIQTLPVLLQLEQVMQEPLIQLSNGENKRLQIAKAILSDPELLILDNPFIGLDTAGRAVLSRIINTLSNAGIKIILITPAFEIP